MLDQFLIDQFVEEAKTALAEENELILLTTGKANAWAAAFMRQPASLNYPEFSEYIDIVGSELVACGVLKVDNRRYKGMAHNPDRMRVSQSWWRKAHADSD